MSLAKPVKHPGASEQMVELQAALQRALETEAALRAQIEQQQRQLEEKSDLLKEVNHRAKNSLQMAMAMLSMQALSSPEAKVAKALEAASQRLGYLARVHEMLYQRGDDVQEIQLGDFLKEIGDTLAEAYPGLDVTLRYELDEVTLDVSRAVNAALLAGEAMLNSYKYAFRGGRAGTLVIACRSDGHTVHLMIKDDGVGFQSEERRGSLGMRLLRALGRALGGTTEVDGSSGTVVSISFPLAATGAVPAA